MVFWKLGRVDSFRFGVICFTPFRLLAASVTPTLLLPRLLRLFGQRAGLLFDLGPDIQGLPGGRGLTARIFVGLGLEVLGECVQLVGDNSRDGLPPQLLERLQPAPADNRCIVRQQNNFGLHRFLEGRRVGILSSPTELGCGNGCTYPQTV